MTTTAIVIMSLSISSILLLLLFCLYRVMTAPMADE